MEMEEEVLGNGRASRRTRSQVAPDWSAQESLILVNEVSAVEGECRKTLSSFQKWKIVVQNCNALDVNRNLDQCRRRWDSLVLDYKKIKHLQQESTYWSIDGERRKYLGLPESFDLEVFKAIAQTLKEEEDRAGTDPDSDPEAVADGVDVVAESVIGSKKQRHQMLHKKRGTEERVRPQKHSASKRATPDRSSSILGKAKPQKERVCDQEEQTMVEASSVKEMEQLMVARLRENAELINAITAGSLTEGTDFRLADLKNLDAIQTDMARRQGDELIAYLGNLSDTLDKLRDLVQGCR